MSGLKWDTYVATVANHLTPEQAVKDGSMCAAALSLPVVLDYLGLCMPVARPVHESRVQVSLVAVFAFFYASDYFLLYP